MNRPLARPWTLDEFLVWEQDRPERWEFDGVQPVPRGMVGGSRSRPVRTCQAWLLVALSTREAPPREACGSDLKVVVGDVAPMAMVFEVLSPSTERTDRSVRQCRWSWWKIGIRNGVGLGWSLS